MLVTTTISSPNDNDVYYDHTVANHVLYREKIQINPGVWRFPHYIRFEHNFDNHRHYVIGQIDVLQPGGGSYSWPLEAAPFTGPAPQAPDNTNLSLFTITHPDALLVNEGLTDLDNPGITTDVDRHHTLLTVTCATHTSPTWTRGKYGNEDLETLLFRPRSFTGGGELGGDKLYGN